MNYQVKGPSGIVHAVSWDGGDHGIYFRTACGLRGLWKNNTKGRGQPVTCKNCLKAMKIDVEIDLGDE